MTTKTLSGLDAETLDLALAAIRQFAATRLPEAKLLALEHDDEFPVELVREICGSGLGIQLLFIPEDCGGMGGGALDVYRICEAMARIDLGVATGVLATFLGSDPIAVGATPEQRRHWLGRLAEEGLLMAYAATEPQAGSDLAALRTTATPVRAADGTIEGYTIRGDKQWISNGGYADVYSVLANAPGGPSWFLVERGAAGFSHGKPEDKHGIRISNTAALCFEDVFVPAGNLVGGVEGQGLVQAQKVFGYTRLMVAAFGLGCGWAALDRAIPYSTTRIQAGSPLSEKQGYTHKLIVPHAVRLEAARAHVEETARRIDAGEGLDGGLNTEGAVAKYLATEAGNAAADAAIQALGGYGYTREYMVEKISRDVRISTIYEGTSEIMEMTIARDRWQAHLKTRGDHYAAAAHALDGLDAVRGGCGAGTAALALRALAVILERARLARLTRHQHILLRLGELIALAEGAAAACRRAASAADGPRDPKVDLRFAPEVLAAMARVNARDVALRVGTQGLRLIASAGAVPAGEISVLEKTLGLGSIHAAQDGGLADMDAIGDALYGRRSGGGDPS